MNYKTTLIFLFAMLLTIHCKAQFSGGSGTIEDPYQIGNLTDLRTLSENEMYWGDHFIQTADIDASSTSTWNSGKGYFPIGYHYNVDTSFTGSYDGQLHCIDSLYINRTSDHYGGLFGFLQGAQILNVCLTNVDITAGYDWGCGALAGCNYGGVIRNCSSTGEVTGIDYYTGGLVGLHNYSSGEIHNCYSHCTVDGTYYVGGLVGNNSNSAKINNSYSTGAVSGTNYVGGLIGDNFDVTEVVNSFWDTLTSGQSSSAGGIGETTSEMKTEATYTNAGWDFEGETANGSLDLWGIASDYPYLANPYVEPVLPTVTTQSITNITENSATGNGNITDLGYPDPSEHGVCWNTSGSPTISDNFTTEGVASATGSFTTNMTGLSGCNTYYVRAYATNDAGTVYGSEVTFTTPDETAPVPDTDPLPDVAAECEVTSLTAPTATDNCTGTVTGTHDATLPITTQGTTTVTWTYEDGNGNTSTQTQDVVIDDVTAPVPDTDPLSDVTAECEVTSLTAPTATDNCTGTITGTHDASLPITSQDTTTVIWTYDDGNGNTTTQTQYVVINDVTSPLPDTDQLSDVTAECEVASLTAPTATDNCASTVTGTHDADLPITSQDTTTVTWTYDDGHGNTTTQIQYVVINDVTSPVPDTDPLSDVTAECEVASLTAPTATDNCTGITGTHDASLPITSQDTTTVTWTYDDGHGNTTTQTQYVVIDDITDPTLAVENISVDLDESGNASISAADLITQATDNCGVADTTIDRSAFTTDDIGEKTIEVTLNDINGNSTTESAIVTVSGETTGVNDFPYSNVEVYPNPTSGNIDIRFYGQKADQLIVMDLTGKKVIQKNALKKKSTLNLSKFPGGIYLIKIYLGDEVVYKKVIKK